MDNKIKEFPVTVYGELTKYSDTISRARCRIFYKYANRNGTYITDEFAEKLLSSIPYTPIKGIYDEFNEDYTDHGKKRDEGRIYGIVPENPNLSWEKHLDEDGIEREYACVDVLIFTAIYEEAQEIIKKSQSMEIYEPSIKGEWKIIDGRRLYEYSDGCFLGLQVLGDEVEPCFQGAAFFNLYNSIEQLKEEIRKFSNTLPSNKGGQSKMPEINFKLSDKEKFDVLWNLLNPDFNEEGNWTINCCICDIYEDYAIVYNYDETSYERIYYSKDDETNIVTIDERKKVFIVDVTEEELNALKMIKTLNGGTYENANVVFENTNKLQEENASLTDQINTLNSNFEQKIEEFNITISTLETEREQITAQFNEANNQVASLSEQVNVLNSYKAEVENNEKQAVINSYAELLKEEILSEYKAKIAEYSVVDLDKELAYELKKSNISVYTKETGTQRIPKNEENTGIEAILSKYRK